MSLLYFSNILVNQPKSSTMYSVDVKFQTPGHSNSKENRNYTHFSHKSLDIYNAPFDECFLGTSKSDKTHSSSLQECHELQKQAKQLTSPQYLTHVCAMRWLTLEAREAPQTLPWSSEEKGQRGEKPARAWAARTSHAKPSLEQTKLAHDRVREESARRWRPHQDVPLPHPGIQNSSWRLRGPPETYPTFKSHRGQSFPWLPQPQASLASFYFEGRDQRGRSLGREKCKHSYTPRFMQAENSLLSPLGAYPVLQGFRQS